MTRGEFEQRYGSEVASDYTIVNHDACDEGNLVSIGRTRTGMDVRVNKLLTEADFILGLGQIAPHRVVGFSGGAKIVMPGVCGKQIVSQLHWQGWTTNSRDIFAVRSNPVRDEINAIGDLAKLDFVVNVVMEGTEVVRYYSGNHLQVFRQASGDILRAYSVPIPPSDVVVVEAYPYDLDMQQAAKAVCTGELVVKPGGTVILLSSCPDGWHVNFPELLKTGYLPYSQVVERVGSKQMDQAIGCHLAAFGRVLQTGRVCVVSNHLRKEDIQRMNLVPASSLRQALEQELQRFGRDASISIIRESAKIIPVWLRALRRPLRPQLCPPEDYAEEGDDYSDCVLSSVVAWDHVSWPGNDFYGGSRSTDDGVKAAATDSMFVLTGLRGSYDEKTHCYLPPVGYRTWGDLVTRNRLRLSAMGRLLTVDTQGSPHPQLLPRRPA